MIKVNHQTINNLRVDINICKHKGGLT